jgi:ribonuclease R
VTSFGLFVTLDALYVDGLVHITELGGEYYHFDEARQELRGERTGIRYSVGTRVRVQVSRVDLDGRKIDFRMVRDGEDRPVPRADRPRPVGAVDELTAVRDADRTTKAATRAARSRGAPGAGTKGAAKSGVDAARRSRKSGTPRATAKSRTRR